MRRLVKTSFLIPSRNVVEEAYSIINSHGLVVGVTDTLYGIFASPFCRGCVEKVYMVKRRGDKPIPILCSSIDDVVNLSANINDSIIRFMESVWPGPVTVILPVDKGSGIAENIHLGSYKVGFRVPAAKLPQLLAKNVGGAITGTSANISGLEPARDIGEAIAQLGDNIELYIDSGKAPIGVPSTVLEIVGNKLRIYRIGAVKANVLEELWSIVR